TDLNHVQEADREVVGRGRDFSLHGMSIHIHDQVGKGSAHVDIDGVHLAGAHASTSNSTKRESRITYSPFARQALRLSMSISMSWVIECPGGRYSVSTCVPQEGQ